MGRKHNGKLIVFLMVVVVLMAITSLLAEAGENNPLPPEPKPDGYHLPLDAKGKVFELKNNPFFPNLKITSTEDIHIVLDAYPKLEDGNPITCGGMVSFIIEPINKTVTSTTLTITGLDGFYSDITDTSKPIPPIYRHQDGFMQEKFSLPENGIYTYTQDLSKPHHIFFLLHSATIFIGDAPGQPDNLESSGAGIWLDPAHTQAKLIKNLTESVYIQKDNVTLDGANYNITGPGSGYGIYLNGRSGVTVKNCNVYNFTFGMGINYSSNILVQKNTVNSNATAGISLSGGSNITLDNNTVSLNYSGINIWGPNTITLTNNTISYSTGAFAIQIGQSSGITITG